MRNFKVFLALLLMVALSPTPSFAAETTIPDEDMAAYLQDLSDQRGFEVTLADVESSLAYWEAELADYASVEELADFMGDVIQADYSNLEDLLDFNEISLEDLEALLVENGETLDDYVFLDDLDDAVFFFLNPDFDPGEIDEDFVDGLVTSLQEELGLTDVEIEKLINYLMNLDEELSSEENIAKFEDLAARMEAIGYFETLDELTAEQAQELLSISDELLALLQLDVDYILVKGDTQTEVTILDLLAMDELVNANLKMNISDLEGNLLADLIVTGEMVDSDIITDIGEDVEQATDTVKENTPPAKTEQGGKLPKTAGNSMDYLLIGLLATGAGVLVYRRNRKAC
jgi:processed acidic surface protein